MDTQGLSEQVIGHIKLMRLLPGDVLVFTPTDGNVLDRIQIMDTGILLRKVVPTWVNVLVLAGTGELSVVRCETDHGGAQTEANGTQSVAGQSGQTGAE